MAQYVPREAPSASIADDDIEYAQAFVAIAQVLESSHDAERLTLIVSTCRNAYLTVNALFRDLAEVLGHGARPATLSAALFLLRKGDKAQAHEFLGEATKALRQFADKKVVWDDRQLLHQQLDESLNKATPLIRDEARRVLEKIRTRDEDTGQIWDSKFFALSTDSPGRMHELIEILTNTAAVLDAVIAVARDLNNLPAEDLLFSAESERVWPQIWKRLAEHAELLGMVEERVEGSHECTLRWPALGGRGLPQNVQDNPKSALFWKERVLEQLDRRVRDEYERIVNAFRPNVGRSPLPPPFRVDLTEPQADEQFWPARVVRMQRMGQPVPQMVRVALPLVGIPSSWYNTNEMTYVGEHRIDAQRVASAAIKAAADQGAAVIVFPEYFLPRQSINELYAQAEQCNLVLIGGLEGALDINHMLRNEGVIKFPDRKHAFVQGKQMESVYEREVVRDSELYLFHGTRLGTFGVIMCSDFLENSVMSAFAAAPADLHILFVCALNPQPALFEQCAIADAARLYCNVVIASNCIDTRRQDEASGAGTMVCGPMTPEPRLAPALALVSLGLPAIGGTTPNVACYDVSPESLLTTRRKNVGGYLPCPASRVHR